MASLESSLTQQEIYSLNLALSRSTDYLSRDLFAIYISFQLTGSLKVQFTSTSRNHVRGEHDFAKWFNFFTFR